MKGKKIVPIALSIIVILSFFPTLQASEEVEPPVEEEPLWERDYSDYRDPYIYPGSEEEYYIIGREEFAILDKNGEERWSKTFSNSVNGLPAFKEDRVYLQTGPLSDGEYKLRCLDRDNGTEIWNLLIDSTGDILVNDYHEIFLTDKGENDLTKISSEGELVWSNNYVEENIRSSSSLLTGEQIIISYNHQDSADEILSISSDGDVNWKLSFENESLAHLNVIEDTNEIYTYSRQGVYKVTLEGEKEQVYEPDDENELRNFRLGDNRKYSIEINNELNETYLKSFTEEGNILWNTTIDNLKDEVGFITFSVPGNNRIYCQYRIFTHEFHGVYMLKAFNLDGELEWRHEYNESHQFHAISEDGVIITSTEDDMMQAYQGHQPRSRTETPGFSFTLLLTATIGAIVVYKKKRL